MAHDLVITGGTVVDGTGAPARRADVAIDGDRITAVGEVDAGGAGRVIDADGRLVTPGFVDLHSHLDAQVGWDPTMSSSCWHGVTSVVMGNCGMTFAPVRPGQAEVLATAMESVEDIPASCILDGPAVGLGELRRLPRRRRRAAQGHQRRRLRRRRRPAPLRGRRRRVRAGLRGHRRPARRDGRPRRRCHGGRCARLLDLAQPVPPRARRSQRAGHLVGPVGVLRHRRAARRELGRGVLESAPRYNERERPGDRVDEELAWMAELSRAAGRPFTFNLQQIRSLGDHYRRVHRAVRARPTAPAPSCVRRSRPAASACCSASPPTPSSTTSRRSSRSRRSTSPVAWPRSATPRCGPAWSPRARARPTGPFERMYLMPDDGAARYVYDEPTRSRPWPRRRRRDARSRPTSTPWTPPTAGRSSTGRS